MPAMGAVEGVCEAVLLAVVFLTAAFFAAGCKPAAVCRVDVAACNDVVRRSVLNVTDTKRMCWRSGIDMVGSPMKCDGAHVLPGCPWACLYLLVHKPVYERIWMWSGAGITHLRFIQEYIAKITDFLMLIIDRP